MTTETIDPKGVLIADRSPHMAGLIAIMLRSLGRKDIREVCDATAALSELQRRPFEVLIIDDDLAGLNGIAFTRKLRANLQNPNRLIPIIMMSAAPDARQIAEARDAGVTEFLRKPFAASHLKVRLDSIETRPRDFIDNQGYTGPDRRRRTVDTGGKERREPGRSADDSTSGA